MSAPWHLIEEKLEDAMQTALLTEYGGSIDTAGYVTGGSLDGWYIFKGFILYEVVPPFISIVCTSSEPSEPNVETASGNQTVMMTLDVRGHKNEDTRDGAAG